MQLKKLKIFNYVKPTKRLLSLSLMALMVIPTVAYSISNSAADVKAAGFYTMEEDSSAQEGGTLIDCFPDKYFAKYVYEEVLGRSNWETDKYQYDLTYADIDTIQNATIIDIGGSSIEDVTGIENFTALEMLNVTGCNNLKKLDLTHNKALTKIAASISGIETINISENRLLTSLQVAYCRNLTQLNTSNNPALTELLVYNSGLTEINLTNNEALETLYVDGTNLTELNISNNKLLKKLSVVGANITELDVRNNEKLNYLNASSTRITEIDVTNNKELEELDVHNTYLTELNVTNNKELKELYVYDTNLTELDVTNNKLLTSLYIFNTGIKKIDLSNQPTLINGLQNSRIEVIK